MPFFNSTVCNRADAVLDVAVLFQKIKCDAVAGRLWIMTQHICDDIHFQIDDIARLMFADSCIPLREIDQRNR